MYIFEFYTTYLEGSEYRVHFFYPGNIFVCWVITLWYYTTLLNPQTKAIIFSLRFCIFVALTSEPVLWRVSYPGLHFRTISAKGMRERLMGRALDQKSDALGSIPSSICHCISWPNLIKGLAQSVKRGQYISPYRDASGINAIFF